MRSRGHDEDRRRSCEAEFDYHLVKPVDTQTLLKRLAKAASVRGDG